jgi:large subunit ribosomal protein L7/L12
MSSHVHDLVETVQNLPVSELVALQEELAQSLGIDPDLIQHNPAPDGAAEDLSARDSFNVVLKSYGENKLSVIKVVREARGVDLHTAKEIVEQGGVIAANVRRDEAEQLAEQLKEAGATCELQ